MSLELEAQVGKVHTHLIPRADGVAIAVGRAEREEEEGPYSVITVQQPLLIVQCSRIEPKLVVLAAPVVLGHAALKGLKDHREI
jgi:hypothetical protein